MAKDNNLKKVSDKSIIMNLLSGSKNDGAEVFLWRVEGKFRKMASVRIESIRKKKNQFCITPLNGQQDQVKDLIGGMSYVDVYIPNSIMLFRCDIKHTEAPTRYYLQIPQFIAQVDRRKDFRMNVHEHSEVEIQFSKGVSFPKKMTQYFYKSCFDVSEGGISFLISRMEGKFFSEGDVINQIRLKTKKFSALVKVKVVMIKDLEPDEFNALAYKVSRVSCSFVDMDQITKRYIQKFIFERINTKHYAIND